MTSAVEWGENVKAIFDVYNNSLLSQMKIKKPRDWVKKREVWTGLSQVFIYRIPPKDVDLEQEYDEK